MVFVPTYQQSAAMTQPGAVGAGGAATAPTGAMPAAGALGGRNPIDEAIAANAEPVVGGGVYQGPFDVNNIGATGALNAQTAANQNILAELGGLKGDINNSLDYNKIAAGFQTDPGYEFARQQGEQAINRLAAAKGGRNSGATLQALSQFNQGLANQQFGNYMDRAAGLQQNRLAQLAGAEQGITGQMGRFGDFGANLATGVGTQLANLYNQYGTGMANIGTQTASDQSAALLGQAGRGGQIASQALDAYGAGDAARDQRTGEAIGLGVTALRSMV